MELNIKTDITRRIGDRINIVLQAAFYSVLLSNGTWFNYVQAGPAGGSIVGGSGSINQSGVTTTINQASSRLAIDWASYNIDANEIVNYLQPNSSAIAFNRILGTNASQIHGQINANGKVILVNPNGIFFSPTASINVGSLIASGLTMNPSDFMNGQFIFNEIAGSDGAVINSGTINASLGGSVTLLGKRVENNGLISAQLGTVNLAAGKEAVVTFDNNGLIGIKVTKEILQDELGIDPAVLNTGQIKAEGGRILITGSVSADIFSQAVNTGDIEQATSVVANVDGTFSLGAGADVVNTGSIDASVVNGDAGQIVMLGENVSSSGIVKADTEQGTAGNIELHASNVTTLTGDSSTSARTEIAGSGGIIKVLADKVGLFDHATVDVSGANGGGTALIGGDREGKNRFIRNANFVFLDNDARVLADALTEGNGGKIITFAKNTARIRGGLYARGGREGGNGGFIETSGLQGFELLKTPDVTAQAGLGGKWLIDPFSITIINSTGTDTTTGVNTTTDPFSAIALGAVLEVFHLEDALAGGASVEVKTRETGDTGTQTANINFNANLDYDQVGNNNTGTLTLTADGDIIFGTGSSINDQNYTAGSYSGLNLNLNAASTGNINLNDASILTHGGNFNVTQAAGFDSSFATIDVGDGSIDLDGVTGSATLGNLVASGGGSNLTALNATSISQQSGTTIQVAVDTTLGTASTTGNINLNQSGNIFGNNITVNGTDVTVAATGAIRMAGDISNTLSVTSAGGGNITDIGNITGDAAATFNTTGSITLDNSNNFSSVHITQANNVTIRDTNGTGNTGLAFSANNGAGTGGITGNLDLRTVGGDITSGGEVNVGGTTFLQVEASTDSILLGNAANTFSGSITLNSASGSYNNVTIANTAATTLGNLDITNDLVVSGSTVQLGTISATNLSVTASSVTPGDVITQTGDLTVSGTTTLNASQDINLNRTGNDFNIVTTTNARNLTLVDSSTIELGNTTITGALNVSSGNADNASIVQSLGTALNIGGDASFATRDTALNNSGNNVVLDNSGNIFGGAVNVVADQVNITDSTALLLGQITIEDTNNQISTFTSTGGDITQQAGTAINNDNVGAVTVLDAGGNNVILEAYTANDNALTNDFSNVQIVNANNVSLVDHDAIALGDMNVAGSLTIHAGMNGTGGSGTEFITSSAGNPGTSVTGLTTLTARNDTTGTNYSINLNSTSNDFNAIDIANAQNVRIYDSAGSVDIQGDVSGNLDLRSSETVVAGTVITNSGELNVSGTADFTVSNGQSINLTNAANTFSNDATFNSAGTIDSIAITDDTNITIQDNLNISGDLDVIGNNVEFLNANIGGNLTANATEMNAVPALVGAVTQGGGSSLVVAGTATFDGLSINLANSGNDFQGAVVVNNAISNVNLADGAGNIQLGSATTAFTANTLNVSATGGNITQGNTITVSGAASFDSGTTNDILLNNTNNDFGANVVITNARDAQISDTNTLTVSTANITQDLSLQANGAITLGTSSATDINVGRDLVIDSGNTITETLNANLTVAGSTQLTANSGGVDYDISLNNINNDFNDVNIISANNVSLRDSTNSIGIQGNVNGTLTVTADDSVAGSVITNPGGLNVTGAATFNIQAGESVDLSNANNSFTVDPSFSTTSLRSLNINDTSALTLQDGLTIQNDLIASSSQLTFNNTTVGGSLTATSSVGAMSQTAGTQILVTNTTSLLASGGGIDLQQNNDFGGNVSITTTAGGNASIVDSNSVVLGASNVSGNLNVRAQSVGQVNSAPIDNDGIVVGNTATFTVADNSSITLDNPENQMNAVNFLATTAGAALDSVSISNNGSLDLQTLTLTGDLTVDVTGNVTNSGILNVSAGTTRVTGNNISLNNTGNNFNDVVLNGATVSIVDVDGLNFIESSTASNNLSVTATTGNITDANTASINVTNSATFNAGNDVVLDSGNHDFGTLRINSGGSATVTDINDVNLGTSSIVGNLSVIADSDGGGVNNITNTGGAVSVGGTATFTTSNGGNVLLTNTSNQFSGAISASGATAELNNVTIVNNTNTLLQSVQASNNLTVTSSGNITDSATASITVGNNTTLSANGNNIELDGNVNLNTLTVNNTNNLTVNDSNSLEITSINATGQVTTTSNGLVLGAVNAASVNLDAGLGDISDSNGNATNITASQVVLHATTGIGSADALETQTAELDVFNDTSGNVNINNTGAVTLTNLVNNGNITFNNDQTVTIDNVDAGLNVGRFTMDVANGSVYGVDRSPVDFTTVPDITGDSAFITVADEFGTIDRPIVLRLSSELFLDATFSSTYFYNGVEPPILSNTSDLQVSVFDAINSVSGQKLIEVESIADIDPAIFTAIRNYNYDDISIRLPSDQLYEDELERLEQ